MPEDKDSGQEREIASVPTPKISSASGAQPSSASVFDEERVAQKVADILRRENQSEKDKRYAKVDHFYEDMDRLKQYVAKSNGDVEAAYRNMALDDYIAERKQPVSQPESQGRPDRNLEQQSTLQSKTADILNEWGIPPDDPELAKLATKAYGSETDWIVAVSKFGAKRAKQDAPASPSSVSVDAPAQPTANRADKDRRQEQVAQELDGLYHNYSANKERIKVLEAEQDSLLK